MGQSVTVRAEYYTFSMEKGNENYKLERGYFVHHGIVSEVKGVEFVSDRMSYLALRGRWCNFILLNAHKSNE